MNQYLMKSVLFYPAITDPGSQEKLPISALVLEVNENGIANLTVFDPKGGSYMETDIPMRKPDDDGSFATWSPQA